MLLPYDVWVWCLMLPLRPRFLLNLQTSPKMPWDWLTTRGAPDTVNQIPSPLMMLVATLVTVVSLFHWSLEVELPSRLHAATDNCGSSCRCSRRCRCPCPCRRCWPCRSSPWWWLTAPQQWRACSGATAMAIAMTSNTWRGNLGKAAISSVCT